MLLNIKPSALSRQNKLFYDSNLNVKVVEERNNILFDFSKSVLEDRYLLSGESYQHCFARVAKTFSDNDAHAERMYNYISNMWFMPATPVLSNGGTDRGMPISCFCNELEDSLDGIMDVWNENVRLASNGGGIGNYWGNMRSIGEKVGNKGVTCGIIPFLKVTESMTLAVSQGSLRRGSIAAYMPVDHPEIEEFIDIRRPTGGDPNRKALNIHHAVVIKDAFMKAVENGTEWNLVSPKTKDVIKTIDARLLWIKILTNRLETGEPYLLFIDNVNDQRPDVLKKLDLKITTSNLCSEIMLHTGKDYNGKTRTSVCCLGSMNLYTYNEWKDNPDIIIDCMRFLDNVLDYFISEGPVGTENARYSAFMERSVGLGVMGLHSLLQKMNIPFESDEAVKLNGSVMSKIRKEADRASFILAKERGPCPDAKKAGFNERFSHKLAIAPTASISLICNGVSPGINPYISNIYQHKTLSGSIAIKNIELMKIIEKKKVDVDEIVESITHMDGSIQHLPLVFTAHERNVFKTGFEIDQNWVIKAAAERQKYVDQGQSIDLYMNADVHKRVLHDVHLNAWKMNIKSLYYLRSKSIKRAESNTCFSCAG